MLVLAVVVMGAAVIIVQTLNAATWKADRLRVTNEAFAKAKEALVARAVADNNRPGSLPCPDLNNDGVAELFAGTQCPNYVGRLPWRTLALPDLRDAEGERLWYVLSPSHRDHSTAEPINSNTPGQIAINGAPPSTVLAVLISPGRPLLRTGAPAMQARDCPGNCNLRTNYLDLAGGVDNAAGSTGGPINLKSVLESATFNDRLLAIHADDIMPLVERRAGREISLGIAARYQGWQIATGRGFYPWAASFNNDPANPGPGVSGTLHGHFPVDPAPVVWTAATGTLSGCVGVGTPTIRCTGTVALGLLSITARTSSIATQFLQPPTPAQVNGIAILPTSNYAVNAAAERLDFSFTAMVGLTGFTEVVVTAPQAAGWAPAASPWLVNNQWNHIASYALSHGHKITGPGACTGLSPCISTGGPADREAVVLMAGRPLAGQTRVVPPQLNAYFEQANLTPDDMALERNLRTAGFNDQPIVVRP